jgi:hypothetical protein
MRKINFIVLLALFFCVSGSFAQTDSKEHHNIRWGIVASIGNFWGDREETDRLREYNSASDREYSCGIVYDRQHISMVNMGLNAEYFLYHNRIGLSGGLHLTQIYADLHSDGNYFYWLESSGVNAANYLRINDIEQTNYYIAVPLEVKYFTKRRESLWQLYAKLGLSLNCKISDKTTVFFHEDAMNKYDATVKSQLPNERSPFFAYLYPAVGVRVGRPNQPQLNFELHLSNLMLSSPRLAPFVTPKALNGASAQVSISFPLNKNVPIGKTDF